MLITGPLGGRKKKDEEGAEHVTARVKKEGNYY